MVVKSKRGRRRYIAFRSRSGEALSDEQLLAAFNSALTPPGVKYKVIQFDGIQGIVRVSGEDQKKATEAINGLASGVLETLRTSGTLRTLREGILHSRSGASR